MKGESSCLVCQKMDKRAIEAGARAQTCLPSRPLDYTKDYHGQHQITKMTILEYPHYNLPDVTKLQLSLAKALFKKGYS